MFVDSREGLLHMIVGCYGGPLHATRTMRMAYKTSGETPHPKSGAYFFSNLRLRFSSDENQPKNKARNTMASESNPEAVLTHSGVRIRSKFAQIIDIYFRASSLNDTQPTERPSSVPK